MTTTPPNDPNTKAPLPASTVNGAPAAPKPDLTVTLTELSSAGAEGECRTALPVILAKLSHEQVVALADEAPRELERRKAKLREDMKEAARALGITPERLLAAQRAKGGSANKVRPDDPRHFVKAVYRDPVTGDTWAGRGQAPAFVEFGTEINPKTGKPLPLRKFWISEQEKHADSAKPGSRDGK